jgi:hypothetical protein
MEETAGKEDSVVREAAEVRGAMEEMARRAPAVY